MITQITILPPTSRQSRSYWQLLGWCLGIVLGADQVVGQATITVDLVEEKTGQPLPCRVELRDAKGRPQKARGAVHYPPWSIVDGNFVFRGKAGDYRFDVSHGPQFARGGGGFTLDRDGEGTDVVRLPRYADLAQQGWFAGDLLTAVPSDKLPLWLLAEDLHMAACIQASKAVASPDAPPSSASEEPSEVSEIGGAAKTASAAPVIASRQILPKERWLDGNSYYDDRVGSGLILHNWQPPAAVPEHVPSSRLLVMASQQGGTHAEIARLWAADTPMWLASGHIASIQILAEHVTRDGRTPLKTSAMYHPEPNQFQGARGPGRLVENLYWQVLETGLRIPPSAGSGVGRTTSPLGYNRVYVAQTSATVNPTSWWDGLRAGRSFVTNGPLLTVSINRRQPGYVFDMPGGSKLNLDVSLDLTVADPVEYVDVIFNGEALYHARLDEHAKRGGKIPALEVTESGWLLVRVVTQYEESYRMATTAPYYIQFDGQSRISARACQMFLEWLDATIATQQKTHPERARNSTQFYSATRDFWLQRKQQATVD